MLHTRPLILGGVGVILVAVAARWSTMSFHGAAQSGPIAGFLLVGVLLIALALSQARRGSSPGPPRWTWTYGTGIIRRNRPLNSEELRKRLEEMCSRGEEITHLRDPVRMAKQARMWQDAVLRIFSDSVADTTDGERFAGVGVPRSDPSGDGLQDQIARQVQFLRSYVSRPGWMTSD
jgi:hypothetical protein